ncbi:hypothetical protein DO73_5092 [Burkholderia pseudomallei]|nr:hypothetical protein DO73_5092 [Burkholderia pseudomallei]KGD18150.1 hypothetical protein DO70_4645 [Burkholderia pseudomallei]KGD51154.1 hypothetical protein DP43_5351 [Burkholderia pseudomallei]
MTRIFGRTPTTDAGCERPADRADRPNLDVMNAGTGPAPRRNRAF